jgi:hypothetical protein
MVTQAAQIGESKTSENSPSEGAKSPDAPTAFDAAVEEFLAYVKGYRQYSAWTVGAYGFDPYFVPISRHYVGQACAGSESSCWSRRGPMNQDSETARPRLRRSLARR